ncbi:AMP-dependent synthetase and ligase [Rhodopseudomonas palustris TIE-1]|uniref:class I adenylate-forming enzyme family protein n=1 Tax=Rhodopseudomonas palustris TaxID=1076 RepID=UPI000164B7B7|nr:AMP-binding protein [Rhodopseudomonas palustris]ACF00114.1 AMP-dependent synthetase and ligase [Rhodopseudomonas palustris TIE-1]
MTDLEAVSRLRRLADVRTLWRAEFPKRIALSQGDARVSYGELADQIDATAAWFYELGYRAGERIILVGENSAALLEAMFAASALDLWVVMLNARLSKPEIDAIRAHCRPRATIYFADRSPDALQHGEVSAARRVVHPSLGTVLIDEEDLGGTAEPVLDDPAEQIALLMYTSGSTGTPKGVMLSHRSVLTLASTSASLRQLRTEDRLFLTTPMTHVMGLFSVSLSALLVGATVVIEQRFDPETVLNVLKRERITVFPAVPTVFYKLLHHIETHNVRLDLPSLRFIWAGGSLLEAALAERTRAVFGLPLHNGYGMTEASSSICLTSVTAPAVPESVGWFLPGLEWKLVAVRSGDAADSDTPDVGELLIRGPTVMKGYFRDLELTARTLDADGWLTTGDLARVADGQVYIVGRSKDMIVRSGFNVYPAEVERAINAHPEVVHSAVVGRREQNNERIIAFVERAPASSVSDTELDAFLAGRLAGYKRPQEFRFVDKLPLATNGKVLKHRLALHASDGAPVSETA